MKCLVNAIHSELDAFGNPLTKNVTLAVPQNPLNDVFYSAWKYRSTSFLNSNLCGREGGKENHPIRWYWVVTFNSTRMHVETKSNLVGFLKKELGLQLLKELTIFFGKSSLIPIGIFKHFYNTIKHTCQLFQHDQCFVICARLQVVQ